MKIALVYDRVNKWGGAERVLLALHELFPDAPLYTAVYNPEAAPWARIFPKVIPSFLQNFPLAQTRHDLYAPLMPIAFESFDFSDYDLVISVTSEAAKGIITKHGTRHICYCLTPTRYLWSHYQEYFHTPFRQAVASTFLKYFKGWDVVAASRPDVMVGISKNVARRIKQYYGRNAEVIYPPVTKFSSLHKQSLTRDKSRVSDEKTGEYFLVVSRLVPYKRVDLVVECFNRLKWPLVIVGTGSEERKLKKMAGENISFAGYVGDEELAAYYAGCKALIFPQEEDFGIVTLEAQSFGKPVIAYRAGGALETIIDGKTGVFFDQQTPEVLKMALEKFIKMRFDNRQLRKNVKKFSKESFLTSFTKLV